jgi:hypothetical protein
LINQNLERDEPMMKKVAIALTNRFRTRRRRPCRSAPVGALALFALLLPRGAAADSWTRDSEARANEKPRYNLFHPTPRPLLRELATDRPDVTESPYTVDAGHFQAELSFFEYGRDRVRIDDGNRKVDAEQWAVLPANLKIGLLNNVDLQLVVAPYLRSEAGGTSASGFGDVQLRVKVNLWGNDGPHPTFGDTALAVMPFVEFPAGDDDLGLGDELEGGIIVPFATALPHGFSLGLMAEFDFVESDDGGHDFEFLHTASLGHDLYRELAGYVEYVGVAADGDYSVSLGAGLTYGLSADVQLDGGVLVGLNDDAEDFAVFAGMSFRL